MKITFQKKNNVKKGFTLVEMIVVLGILSVIGLLVSEFQAEVFTYNRLLSAGNTGRTEGTKVVKQIAAELRAMSPSSAGGYAIEDVGTSTITFYNDLDDDGVKERIRYYLSGTTLYKGTMKPIINAFGQTLTSEATSTIITNVVNDAVTPIFTYYDTGYNGGQSSATSSSALTYPINISNIRLIKISVFSDNNKKEPLAPLQLQTQVSIRNLKDNL